MLPLDEQYVEVTISGRKEKLPSLHPRWKQDVGFVSYTAPPVDEDRASLEEWTERLDFIQDDLRTLLRMSHQEFWCQAVFDETLHRCVDSYLKSCPRSYDVIYNLPADVKQRHDEISKQFFLVCVRMATHKESKDHFITPKVFGDILYENFIFDIPKIMDLCVLYGAGNGPLLNKMISNIFTQQPQYQQDLTDVVPTIMQVFDSILLKCGVKSSSHEGSPLKLAELSGGSKSLNKMPLNQFQDVIFYLHDTFQTLWSFIDVYPEGAMVFSNPEFMHRLLYLYENLVPKLSEAFKERDWDSDALKKLLKKKVHQSQCCLLKTFRQVVFNTYLRPLLEDGLKDLELEEAVEGYLSIMTSLLAERRFSAHLEHLYPFADDVDLLLQTSYSLDETQVEYIKEGILDAYSVHGPRQGNRARSAAGAKHSDDSSSSEAEAEIAGAGAKYEELGACAARVTGVELESLISSVKDLLPDLGEGFIELCLEENDYNVEAVINTVLEDKLPVSLQGLDRSMPRTAAPAVLEEPEDTSVLAQRRNVYDNDEFDVFKKDNVDTSRIHKGKKDKFPEGAALLDDKEELDDLKPLYNKYGSEFVESSMYNTDQQGGYDYEDEYDDTYDFNLIGADDADSADELTVRRPFTLPRVLGGGRVEDETEVADDDDGPEEAEAPKDHFIADPAKLREQAAMRRASKAGRGGRHQHHHQHPAPSGEGHRDSGQGQRTYDVKGKPKGQGQDKDVVRNRAWKEKNKGHNRRAMADKKRKL